ncbi:MAG: hypothetical protein ACOZE5_06030 [Verrucomicrobiota bacterium]
MHTRLLSFLSDFERALRADEPSPEDGEWQASRTVNYRNGLARLQLDVARPDRTVKPRGAVLLQSYKLADGTPCLKAQLSWAGAEQTVLHSIFAKPGCDWKTEARRLAAKWMAGAPVVVSLAVEEPEAAAVAVG